jgi:hypothetical protein
MLSRFVGAALVLLIGGVLLAGEYTGVVTKYDSKEGITFKSKKKGDKKPTEMTLKVAKGVKITKGEDTIVAEEFDAMVFRANEPDSKSKGVFAKLTTKGEGTDEKVVSIEVLKGKSKKKDKTDK